MSSSLRLLLRLLAPASLILAASAGAAGSALQVLPHDGAPARGLLIDGALIPDGTELRAFVAQRARSHESAVVRLVLPGRQQPVEGSYASFGMSVDVDAAVRRAMAVGRDGPLEERVDQSLKARSGEVNLPLTWRLDPAPLERLLSPIKEDTDEPPVAARLDLVKHSVIPHRAGRYLDLFAAYDALTAAASLGSDQLRVPSAEVPPFASAEYLERIDITQVVGHFETRFGYLGGETNRAANIANAASKLDGQVLLPGQILSFNNVVGHRTLDNGFHKGWEIFKGEMVEGVGGGTCQVASTLHAAAYLAGLDVLERSPHSRPSGYIVMGLDSTVVDGQVDLKLRNPFDFPIVLHAQVDRGVITFELLGQQRPVTVTFKRDVVGAKDYKRVIRETSYLPEGKVVLKQRGIRGYSVRRVRSLHFRDGSEREEVTLDVYPATAEIYLVPPGTDESVLPPLPGEEREDSAPAADSAPQPVQIVLAPGVHAPSADQANAPARLVIER